MSAERHYCPSCSATLVSEPAGTSLRCVRCTWRLVSSAAWRKLPPREQGYLHYMQASWPTSELAAEQNPYAIDSAAWRAFREGEQRAVQDAQDGEE